MFLMQQLILGTYQGNAIPDYLSQKQHIRLFSSFGFWVFLENNKIKPWKKKFAGNCVDIFFTNLKAFVCLPNSPPVLLFTPIMTILTEKPEDSLIKQKQRSTCWKYEANFEQTRKLWMNCFNPIHLIRSSLFGFCGGSCVSSYLS